MPVRSQYQKQAIHRKLWKRDEHFCFYCQIPLTQKTRTIDHLTPTNKGGSNNLKNLVLCCQPCNQAKDNMTLAEFVDFVAKNGGIYNVKLKFGPSTS